MFNKKMQAEELSEEWVNQLYDALLNSELFSVYRRAFEHSTGHSLSLIHQQVQKTPEKELFRTQNNFCKTLLASNMCHKTCVSHVEDLAIEATTRSKSGACDGRITTTMIPVKMGNTAICFLKTGQVKIEGASLAPVKIKRLFDRLPESSIEKLYESYKEISEVDKDTYFNQLVLLGAFSMQLSSLASEIVENGSSSSIHTERCKRYIGEHLTEKISLDDLAEHINVTTSYLCKQFKKNTGMTIVEYINYHRIQLAKQQLDESPADKIIDVAYQCGFQSLSQFNRTFQKFVGKSPTGYKKKAFTV